MSIDEKTGIQALERDGKTLPMKPGKGERREINYIRHGTQCLTANLHIATGKILSPTMEDTRTEEDFVHHIQRTMQTDSKAGWIFLCDNLNTHKSATLVKCIAQLIGDTQSLGKKGKNGILKTMESRKEYLIDKTHPIRFVYTPKHCSWLNPIEVWFSTLAKRVLTRGNFTSIHDLKKKITQYITYYSTKLAKPYNWSVVTNSDIENLIQKVTSTACLFMK